MTEAEFFGEAEYYAVTVQTTFSRKGRVKVCNPGADLVDHLLPDATTLKPGHMFYILNIHGTRQVDVHDNDDGLVVDVPAKEYAIVCCYDNSTSAGSWISMLSTGDGVHIPP